VPMNSLRFYKSIFSHLPVPETSRHYFVELGSIDLRPLFGSYVERVAHRAPGGTCDTLLNKLVIDFLLNLKARTYAADLAKKHTTPTLAKAC
jgi:hypothetical protein